ELREIVDQAEFNRKMDERIRLLRVAVFSEQANQRLHADDVAAIDVDLGLKCASEPAIAYRQAQSLFKMNSFVCRLLNLGIEQRRAALFVALDLIHCTVGVVQKRLIVQAVIWIEGDADRGGGPDFVSIDDERLFDLVDDLIDDRSHGAAVAKISDEQKKFIAAKPGETIGF